MKDNSYLGFVYLWTNQINGKKYIGSHKGKINDGYIGSGKLFNRAISKYGIENFHREILEYVTEDILVREQHYLDLHNAAHSDGYYNIASQAGGGWDHVNKNKELKQRLIQEQSARVKKYIKENGHPRGMKGKKHTEESNQKRHTSNTKWANENIARAVYQFDYNGNLIAEYVSIQEAAKSVNGSPSNIKYTCEGKFKNTYKYQWSYTKESPGKIDLSETKGKKKVNTPAGVFETVTDAVKHFGFTSTTQVRRRCLSEKYSGWNYEQE